jgi:hypothetical protein
MGNTTILKEDAMMTDKEKELITKIRSVPDSGDLLDKLIEIIKRKE